ncbi:MAG: hypothetical protein WBP45_02635 [Daejeonella sp.]
MKKLLCITILLITSFGYLKAQNAKSAKDDVIDLLNKTTKSTIGKRFERTGIVKESVISFTKYKNIVTSEEDNSSTKEQYVQLKWENLDPVLKGKAGYNDEEIIKIRLYFTNKIKYRKIVSTNSEKEDSEVSTVEIFIPAKEFESVWQTCQRLAQLSREENKDPNKPTVVEEDFDIEPVKAVVSVSIPQTTEKPEKEKPVKTEPEKVKKVSKNSRQTAVTPVIVKEDTKPVAIPPVIAEPPATFSLDNSAEYYYVVNVADPSMNLSPSRFRIGQLNRMNFPDSGIKHELKEVNNQNQLIVVGLFPNKKDLLDYYKHINPVLSQLMKINGDKYNAFYISRQNLDKLNSREKIDQYADFFKKNF